jgi:hypothetical protein
MRYLPPELGLRCAPGGLCFGYNLPLKLGALLLEPGLTLLPALLDPSFQFVHLRTHVVLSPLTSELTLYTKAPGKVLFYSLAFLRYYRGRQLFET